MFSSLKIICQVLTFGDNVIIVLWPTMDVSNDLNCNFHDNETTMHSSTRVRLITVSIFILNFINGFIAKNAKKNT